LKESVLSTSVSKPAKLDYLIKRLTESRRVLAESETAHETRLDRIHPTYLNSAHNLAHYIALRHRDIRLLQQQLAQLGLSSLGRTEAHVMATLDAVLAAFHGLAGRSWQHPPRGLDFLEGNKLLREHTETLLGPSPANREVRIMVTVAVHHVERHMAGFAGVCTEPITSNSHSPETTP
jgi:pyruvate kinase